MKESDYDETLNFARNTTNCRLIVAVLFSLLSVVMLESVAAAGLLPAPNSGLAGNPLFRNALQPYKNGRFSNAGRALTKHPNIVGAKDAQELARRFGNQSGINGAASDALKNIMRNGTRSSKTTKAYGDVIDFKLPDGMGARFNAVTGEWIGFLGRGVQ